MRAFPENYELECFFEVEPTVLDSGVPWVYNRLTFEVASKNGELRAILESGYESIYINWMQESESVLELCLRGVKSLKIIDEKNLDTMVLSFRSSEVSDLILRIHPLISVQWGYNDQV